MNLRRVAEEVAERVNMKKLTPRQNHVPILVVVHILRIAYKIVARDYDLHDTMRAYRRFKRITGKESA
jgi:hypothetical protein